MVDLLRVLVASAAILCMACDARESPVPRLDKPEAPKEPLPAPEPARRDPPEGRTRVVLLGTGTPHADPERSGPCVAVVVDDVPYLVDMGPGLVRRAEEARRRGVVALDPPRLSRVFVTHLHSDHTVGFPDFLYTPWVLGREEPLEIWGPPGIGAMARHVQAAWREDVRVRTEGLEEGNDTGHRVVVHEIEPGVVHRDERVTVTAFPVEHGSWRASFGYRFDTPDRRIVVSGDTAPSDAVARACDGCDLLLHEVYSHAGWLQIPEDARRYHAAFHTSSRELATVAAAARPGRLVLYHHLLFGASPDELVAEVRAGWDGDVVYGRDLDAY